MIWVYIYTYTFTYDINKYIYIHIYTHIYIYTYILSIYIHTCMHTYIHTYIYMTYICIFISIYTHMCVNINRLLVQIPFYIPYTQCMGGSTSNLSQLWLPGETSRHWRRTFARQTQRICLGNENDTGEMERSLWAIKNTPSYGDLTIIYRKYVELWTSNIWGHSW